MQPPAKQSRQIIGTITRRGQVTVPAEVRRILGAETPGKIVFQIEGDEVHLLHPAFTLETAYGSVEPLNRPENFDAMIREAREEHVEATLRTLRGEPD
jgi:AbrB family looped-hinge helix DNA binding protein